MSNLMDKLVPALFGLWCSVVVGTTLAVGWALWEDMIAESWTTADIVMGCFLWVFFAMFFGTLFTLAGYVPYREWKDNR